MIWLKYLLILCLIISLNICQDHENEYCTHNSIYSITEFLAPNDTNVICSNMTLNITTKLRLESQTKPHHKRTYVQLINVKGNLTRKTFVLLPFMTDLLIYRCNITSFDTYFSYSVYLHIAESIFPNISKEMFSENRYMKTIGFHSNPDIHFGESPFKPLHYLDNLIMYNQSLPKVDDKFLKGLDNLKYILLNKNSLKDLHENTFESLKELRDINLDNNPLEYFTANIRYLHKLERLSLLDTNIKEFYVTEFFPLRKMRILEIPYPAAREMGVSGLAIAFPNLRNITVDSQDIEESSDMPKLRKFRLAGLHVDRKLGSPSESSIFAGKLMYTFPSRASEDSSG